MTRLVTFSVQTADDAFDLIALVNDRLPNASFVSVSKMMHEEQQKAAEGDGIHRKPSDRMTYPKTRARWTGDEDIQIMRFTDTEFADLRILYELSENLGRTIDSIKARRWRIEKNKV